MARGGAAARSGPPAARGHPTVFEPRGCRAARGFPPDARALAPPGAGPSGCPGVPGRTPALLRARGPGDLGRRCRMTGRKIPLSAEIEDAVRARIEAPDAYVT